MRVFLISVVSLLFFSCQKEVQLVKAGRTIDSLVVDHSPVYMFMETKGTDTIIDVNRKNTIGTTNWIFNIDKRLPLKLVIPEIIKLQQKREGATMHKNDAAINYFSYTDSLQKSLAFMPFKEISYAYNSYFSSFYVKENVDYHQHFQTFYVNFRKDSTVSVDGNEVEATELYDFLKEYTSGIVMPKYVGPISLIHDARIFFRAYFYDKQVFKMLNVEYEIKPIIDEIRRIHEILLLQQESGGRFISK